MRPRLTLFLNLASLVLGLLGAGFAAWPTVRPFHGQELMDLTVDATYPHKTPAYEKWEAQNEAMGRLGLGLVAIATVAGAVAQLADRKRKA